LTYEERLARRMVARRRLRRQRIGAVVVAVAAVAAAVVLVVGTGAGGRAVTGSKSAHGARSVVARGESKAVPVGVLPRGGRTLLPGHLIVAFYGIVGTANVLGRSGDPEAAAAAVQRQARAYQRFGRPVQPAFELVTTIASRSRESDGTYSAATDPATVQRYLDAAHRHKLLLILDFQPGRGEFLPEVRRYSRFLVDPSVSVALDPEWKLTGTQVPDQVIGSSPAASINAVSAYLSGLIRARRLPQKLFIIHEFATSELPDRHRIVFRSGLATVLQMDGLGPVSSKLNSYRKVMRGARGFHPGFKVFLRPVDDPVLLTPGQIIRLRPRPDYVSYQ
jgi:hypothetical protein